MIRREKSQKELVFEIFTSRIDLHHSKIYIQQNLTSLLGAREGSLLGDLEGMSVTGDLLGAEVGSDVTGDRLGDLEGLIDGEVVGESVFGFDPAETTGKIKSSASS